MTTQASPITLTQFCLFAHSDLCAFNKLSPTPTPTLHYPHDSCHDMGRLLPNSTTHTFPSHVTDVRPHPHPVHPSRPSPSDRLTTRLRSARGVRWQGRHGLVMARADVDDADWLIAGSPPSAFRHTRPLTVQACCATPRTSSFLDGCGESMPLAIRARLLFADMPEQTTHLRFLMTTTKFRSSSMLSTPADAGCWMPRSWHDPTHWYALCPGSRYPQPRRACRVD